MAHCNVLFQVTDIRKRWSAAAIFNRIGISKKILGEESFDKIVKDINENAEGSKSANQILLLKFTFLNIEQEENFKVVLSWWH